ncbi:MAG: TFIIB-type zinc ribbon-containing protein [Firmicutes bacterium]|nr:TFIIB-type zinc ribbon-containing protein [Bacillota bacterium]
MANNITEQKCSKCGAPMRYDPGSGMYVCDYCGNKIELPQDQRPKDISFSGFDFSNLYRLAEKDSNETLPIYNCVSCGAEVIAPAEQIATTCPYCGNNIVLTDKVAGRFRPDGVIPFRIDKNHLPDAMNKYYKGKVLLPKNFFSRSTMGNVTGVYVPFWMFSGRLRGQLVYHAGASTSHRQGDYILTRTKHYEVKRDADLSFEDIPIDASGRIDDKLMDSLEPFDMSDARDFDMRYLAGFTADRFDKERHDVADRAKRRMSVTAEKALASSLREYDSAVRTGGSLAADIKTRYLLLPVYLFTLTHGNQEYKFAVNGQTGKVVGDLPVSKSVSAKYFAVRMIIPAAAIIGIFVAKYMMGA